MKFLIQAYMEWCRQLGLRVNLPKTQLWMSEGDGVPVTIVDGVTLVPLTSRASFRIVGVEQLGLNEAEATKAHTQPRMSHVGPACRRKDWSLCQSQRLWQLRCGGAPPCAASGVVRVRDHPTPLS